MPECIGGIANSDDRIDELITMLQGSGVSGPAAGKMVLGFLALLEYFDRGKEDSILHEFGVLFDRILVDGSARVLVVSNDVSGSDSFGRWHFNSLVIVVVGEGEYTWVMVVKGAGSGSKIPREPLVSDYSLLGLINARMALLVDTERLGQTLINILRLASVWANCAASVPDSVPPVSESAVSPGVFGGTSTPVGSTGSGQAELFG
jgi:hypothetical protein